MPLYEYRCLDCDHVFEELVPAGSASPAPGAAAAAAVAVCCSRCDGARVERVISSFAVNHAGRPGGAPRSGGEPCGPSCGCFPS